jgi:hypothetical protein
MVINWTAHPAKFPRAAQLKIRRSGMPAGWVEIISPEQLLVPAMSI